jgi:hypothetical protein
LAQPLTDTLHEKLDLENCSISVINSLYALERFCQTWPPVFFVSHVLLLVKVTFFVGVETADPLLKFHVMEPEYQKLQHFTRLDHFPSLVQSQDPLVP